MAKLTTEIFIKRAKEAHGDRYDYSKSEYIKDKIPVLIICPEHGEFWQDPGNHYRQKKGCNKCGYKVSSRKLKEKILSKKQRVLVQPEDYKLIPLTKGKFAKVDNEDFDRVKDINWSYNNQGYAKNDYVGRMHRFIMNCPDDKVVDHINHDTIDNRKVNLRICDQQENCYNSSIQVGKSSIYKGVSWDKSRRLWMSYITVNKKRIILGYFKDEIDAAKSYDDASIKYHGEFGFINGV